MPLAPWKLLRFLIREFGKEFTHAYIRLQQAHLTQWDRDIALDILWATIGSPIGFDRTHPAAVAHLVG